MIPILSNKFRVIKINNPKCALVGHLDLKIDHVIKVKMTLKPIKGARYVSIVNLSNRNRLDKYSLKLLGNCTYPSFTNLHPAIELIEIKG